MSSRIPSFHALPTGVARTFELAARVALGAVFLYAAVGKLLDPATFVEQVANYRLFAELAPWAAVVVPAVEVVAGVVLLMAPRSWRQAAAVVIGGLLVVFSIAIARAWYLGINAECGCFGTASPPIGLLPLLRNTGLFMLALVVVLLDVPRRVQPAAESSA